MVSQELNNSALALRISIWGFKENNRVSNEKNNCDDHFELQVDFGGSRGAPQMLPMPKATRKQDPAKKHAATQWERC